MAYEKSTYNRSVDWAALMEKALTTKGSVGSVYNRFHEYSISNMYLFAAQGLFEPIASRKRWMELGRTMIAGARPKEVIVPNMRRWKERDDNGELVTRERLVGYNIVRGVYGLSDTEGPEPQPLKTTAWDQDAALKKLGITKVPFAYLHGNTQGYSHLKEIAINPVAAKPEKTLVHELGHVVLGHTTGEADETYHRGIHEFQAEGTAYIVLKELDRLDPETDEICRGYIQSWMEGERPPDKAIREVFTAADKILHAGRIAGPAVVKRTVDYSPYILNTDTP